MFETIVERILKQKLGKYIEGIASNNLNFAVTSIYSQFPQVWGGNILLENLKIRKNIFESTKLPLKIAFGKIQKLQIVLPWTKLSSSPVEIILETLMIVVNPQTPEEWEYVDSQNFEKKQEILNEFVHSFSELLKVQLYQKEDQKGEGYLDRLITKIVDNVQLKIKNIHIRYESPASMGGVPYSMGMTLKSLTIQTTNSRWEPQFFDRSQSENADKPIHKKLNLDGLAIYLDVDDPFLFSTRIFSSENPQEAEKLLSEHIENKMRQIFPPEQILIENCNYLIQPVQLDLRLVQLTKTDLEKPMFDIELILGELNLKVEKSQYEVVFKLMNYFKNYGRFIDSKTNAYKYKFLRPIFPIHYLETYQVNSEERKINKRFQQRLLPPSAQLTYQTVETQENEKLEDDADEFFDAIDDEAALPQDYQLYFQHEKEQQREEEKKKEQDENFISTVVQRPVSNYNAVDWWKYAITCVIKENRLKKGRKRLYRRLMMVILNKAFVEGSIRYEALNIEDRFLYSHIINSNDISDLKNWASIVLKRKMEKQKEEKEKKANKGFFSYIFTLGGSISDEVDKQSEEFSLSDQEIDQLKQRLGEIHFFDVNELQISGEEKKKLIKVHLNCIFTKGSVTFEDKCYGLEVYLDLLELEMNLKRDDTIGLNIKNQGAGNPLKVIYEAHAIYNVTSYFKSQVSDDLRAQALDKIHSIKESTQMSIYDLFYRRQTKLFIKVAAPVLVLPFKSHNGPLIKEPEEERERTWMINLGQFTLTSQEISRDSDIDQFSDYENFNLSVDSLSLKLYKQNICINVLEEVQTQLQIRVRNKLKQQVLHSKKKEDSMTEEQKLLFEKNLRQADVIVEGNLESLNANFTPDVYNSLVNLKEVIMSVGAEIELQKLREEKDQIIKDSIFMIQAPTKGVRGFLSYWQDYFVVLSGSYLYFYKNKKDLMPQHYIYIADCIVSQDMTEFEALTKQQMIDFNEQLVVIFFHIIFQISSKKENILLAFNNKKEKNTFVTKLVERQQDMRGVNIKDVVSNLIHQNPNDLGFKLFLMINKVKIRIWKTTDDFFQDKRDSVKDTQWILGNASNVSFELLNYAFDIKLNFGIGDICLSETQELNQDIFIHQRKNSPIDVQIDVLSMFSPNLQDAEIIVKIDFGHIFVLYEPNTINQIVKFFRNVRTSLHKDLEIIQLQLVTDQYLNQIEKESQSTKKKVLEQTCQNIKNILIKLAVEAQGIDIYCIHQEYLTQVLQIKVDYAFLGYKMYYDHDVMEGRFGNGRIYDLTNYPKTIDPSKAKLASLHDLDSLNRQEVLGIRMDGNQNTINFNVDLFSEQCPLHGENETSALELDIRGAQILYCYELTFRVIDYFFDKFLWAFTDSDYYEDQEERRRLKEKKIDLDLIETQEIYAFDLEQDITKMRMHIRIHRPYVIMKSRPYLEHGLEVDLGEITLTNDQRKEAGRFKSAPYKEVLVRAMILDAKDMGIRYSKEDFIFAEPFDLKMEFLYLNYSNLLPQVSSSCLDKSYAVNLSFQPALGVRMTQQIYTYLINCIDLNLAYTDDLEEKFHFRNEEEYFRSTKHLIKSKTTLKCPYISVGLFDEEELITEILLDKPTIVIDYYLSSRVVYDIQFQQIVMLYLKNMISKQLLIGNLTHQHRVPILEPYQDTLIKNVPLNEQHQVKIFIEMFPSGQKDFKIDINDVKLFLLPYFYLMVDHFFREGLPTYNDESFDKPNQWDSNYETYPEMHVNLKLSNILLCLTSEGEIDKGIVCQCNVEFEYKRENIKRIRSMIYQKVANIGNLTKEEQEDISLPISWMRFQMFQLCPFICDLSDLEKYDFNTIRRRQLITPFNMNYFYAMYIHYQLDDNQLTLFDKSDIRKDKAVIKVSYNDFRLLHKMGTIFVESYKKFQKFLEEYQKQKSKSQSPVFKQANSPSLQTEEEERKDEANQIELNFLQSTKRALSLITSYTQGPINNSVLRHRQSEISQRSRDTYINSEIQSQILNYETISLKIMKLQSSGIQIVIINDYNNAFYPVFSINIQHFRYRDQTENGRSVGETHLKSMISYYNTQAGEWEPLIEKTELHILVDNGLSHRNFVLTLSKNLNINITDMLTQTLIETYKSLQEKEKSLNKQIAASHNIQSSVSSMVSRRESFVTEAMMMKSIKEEIQLKQISDQLEFKVTPYTIINYTPHKITVKRVFDKEKQGSPQKKQVYHIPKQYTISPGEKIDYEVDYEEEAKSLMRITQDELVRKNDYVNINFNYSNEKNQRINGLNLRDMRTYIHEFTQFKDDYISFGVRFENMRKVLTLRAPHVICNKTDCDYQLKFTLDKRSEIILLKSQQALPLGIADYNKSIEISNTTFQDNWSKTIKISTLIERLPKNKITYLFHGKQYSIIIKEKSDFQKSLNINIKTPVVIKNCLPCNLSISSKLISGVRESVLSKSSATLKEEKEEDIIFEDITYQIPKGDSLQLYNFNLKDSIDFKFRIDLATEQQISPKRSYKQQGFQWAEASYKVKEFKGQKSFLIKDGTTQTTLEVYTETKKSKHAGCQITFYVKNCIINNTDQKLAIYFDKKTPAAGFCNLLDTSVFPLSDKSKVMISIENSSNDKTFSNPFLIDIAAVTNTIQVRKELNVIYEFTVKTELSLVSQEEDIYTKVTTISPCYVLINKTKNAIYVTQEGCLDEFQVIQAEERVPFHWRDIRKPRLARFKCADSNQISWDDKSHLWSFPFPLSELGKEAIINKSNTSQDKHIILEKQLQASHEIVYICFSEEERKIPTYRIENKTDLFVLQIQQKDHHQNLQVLQPKKTGIYSWVNPQYEKKLILKVKYIAAVDCPEIEVKQEVEIDKLDLDITLNIPQPTIGATKLKPLYIDTLTNGYTKVLRISEERRETTNYVVANPKEQDEEEVKEGDDAVGDQYEIPKQSVNVQINQVGLSLITKTYQGLRREFAYFYLEDLKFLVVDTSRRREIQLKVSYMQIDKNIGQKMIFPIIMYPKELVKRRDVAQQKKLQEKNPKKKEQILSKDFFNAYISIKTNEFNILFIEKIDFLLQTMVLKMDDELIGFIFKFTSNITNQLDTNLTGIHEVFSPSFKLNNELEDLQGSEAPEQENKLFQVLERLAQQEDDDFMKFDDHTKPKLPVEKNQSLLLPYSSLNKETSHTVRIPQYNYVTPHLSKRLTQQVTDDGRNRNISVSSNATNKFTEQHSESWLNYKIENKQKGIYIKEYKSSPIEIEVSFLTRVKMDIDMADKKFSLKDKLRIFGLVLTNMDKAPLRINSLITTNIFGTPAEIIFLLKGHYIDRMKKNLFTMIGSSNILGNPANFVNHLGTGVQDFFYKPIEGFVQGPLEGGKGIITGTGSLLKNTVQGTFGSASKMLSSVSKGLLFITDDIDYINRREEDNLDRPQNALEGVGYGLKSTFTGIASGITGVIENPIRGAKRAGVKGFFVGTYQGMSGLVVKPLSGALDFFSKTSEGIKNTASSNEKQIAKIRTMRPFYGRLQLIKTYDEFHAYVVQHLKKINRGRYVEDHFIDALYYDDGKEKLVIVLTEEHLLLVDSKTREVSHEYLGKDLYNIKKKPGNLLSLYSIEMKEVFQFKIQDSVRFERYYRKLRNYIFHVKNDL